MSPLARMALIALILGSCSSPAPRPAGPAAPEARGSGGAGARTPPSRADALREAFDGSREVDEPEGVRSYGLGIDQDGAVIVLLGPRLKRRLPDGSEVTEAAACMTELRVGAITTDSIEVDGERWYLSADACERRRRDGCIGPRCVAPGCGH